MKIDPEKVEKLEWIEQAMQLDAFQKLWSHLEVDIELLKSEGMLVGAQPTLRQANLLRLCGLEPPSTAEEKVATYTAFFAVANYLKNKQALLVANRDVYREGVRQLKEAGQLETEPQMTLTSKK